MKQHIAICAGLYLICVAGAGSASAQGVFSGPRLFGPALAPYQIAAIARSYGLAPATGPVRRGSTYMLLATDDTGQQVRVVVDAYRGDILAVNPVLTAPYRMAQPYYRPPRIIPAPNVAVPPDVRIGAIGPEIKDPPVGSIPPPLPPRLAAAPPVMTPAQPAGQPYPARQAYSVGRPYSAGEPYPAPQLSAQPYPVPQPPIMAQVPRGIPLSRLAATPPAVEPQYARRSFGRLAAAPPAADAAPRSTAPPAKTPLPRPRPNVAANQPAASSAATPKGSAPAVQLVPVASLDE